MIRLADGQRLNWETLPRTEGLESVNVAGGHFHLDALQDPSFSPASPLSLQREPNNQYDSNAIAVWNANRTLQAGYLPRQVAKRLAKHWETGERVGSLVMWEVTEAGKRVAIRILLIRDYARLKGVEFP